MLKYHIKDMTLRLRQTFTVDDLFGGGRKGKTVLAMEQKLGVISFFYVSPSHF
jgi:hypothetical protein